MPFVHRFGRVEDDRLVLERSPKGFKLKNIVTIPLKKVLAVGQRGPVEYVLTSLLAERPKLVPFVFENNSILELARYFLRYRTASPKTLYVYVDCIARYSTRISISPDELISDLKDQAGLVNFERIPKHIKALEDYAGELQDKGLAPCRVSNYVKAIRTFYRVNGIEIKLPYSLSRRSIRKVRAPKPEELQRLLDVADLREKAIISMLALGGFREGTLIKLRYKHVRDDLERGLVPLHIHVEAEITKGKYHDYDTFIGQEAVEYLKLYLEARRMGSPEGKLPPEILHDESPLIRDSRSQIVKPIGERQIYQLVHGLYFKAGLLKPNNGNGYDLHVHSLRKFFKTQLMALGVQPDYIDYMMGHTVDTYHDIESKGIEFLRNIYAGAGLSIRPKAQTSKIDMVKEFIRGMGMNPEEILTRQASAEPHRTYATGKGREEDQIKALCMAFKESLKKELTLK
mgnify:CR=1 FL=1